MDSSERKEKHIDSQDVAVEYNGVSVRIGLDPWEWVIVGAVVIVCVWLWLK